MNGSLNIELECTKFGDVIRYSSGAVDLDKEVVDYIGMSYTSIFRCISMLCSKLFDSDVREIRIVMESGEFVITNEGKLLRIRINCR